MGKASGEKVAVSMCRRFDSRPFQPPPPPSLPGFRVQEAQPFAYAGVDFAGPLYIVNASDTKVWICLYTCCVTRAVHLAPPSMPKMTQLVLHQDISFFVSD